MIQTWLLSFSSSLRFFHFVILLSWILQNFKSINDTSINKSIRKLLVISVKRTKFIHLILIQDQEVIDLSIRFSLIIGGITFTMSRMQGANSNTWARNEWRERLEISEWLERREAKGADGSGSPSFGEEYHDAAHVQQNLP